MDPVGDIVWEAEEAEEVDEAVMADVVEKALYVKEEEGCGVAGGTAGQPNDGGGDVGGGCEGGRLPRTDTIEGAGEGDRENRS